jgi:hypothetical protein
MFNVIGWIIWYSWRSWRSQKYGTFTCSSNWTRSNIIYLFFWQFFFFSWFVNEWRWVIIKRFINCKPNSILLRKITFEVFDYSKQGKVQARRHFTQLVDVIIRIQSMSKKIRGFFVFSRWHQIRWIEYHYSCKLFCLSLNSIFHLLNKFMI